MTEPSVRFLSPQEVAERLSVSRDAVYSWIESGKLRASRPGGRLLRVSEKDLADFLTPGTKSTEGPVLTRRRFTFGTVAGAIASLMFSSVGGAVAGQLLQDHVARKTQQRRAVELFRDIFSFHDQSRLFDVFWGRATYAGSYHPYNQLAGTLLQEALGIVQDETIRSPQPLGYRPQRSGDILVVGGPNSTSETMVAWGFRGADHRSLEREQDPLLPLRWHGGSNERDENAPRDYRITYGMGGGRNATTTNWPLYDAYRQELVLSEPGNLWGDSGERLYLPGTNYLIITNVYNFLDPDFEAMLDIPNMPQHSLPRMLVFEGAHGPGTLGCELLLGDDGIDVLTEITRSVGKYDSYQVLIELAGLEEFDGAYHRFSRVTNAVVQPLEIDAATYREAHRDASVRLAELEP